MKIRLLTYLLLAANVVCAQLTPEGSLNLKKQLVEIPAKFSQIMKDSFCVNIPEGYKARIFHVGALSKPRNLSISPKGILHVSDQNLGSVFAFPDADNNGLADTFWVAASEFSINHDVKFFNGNMYVTEQQKVWKLSDLNDDGIYETRVIFIDSIGAKAVQPTGGHVTRSIAFDSINQKVYVSIGSSCNVCREDYRSVIEQYDLNGKNGRVYASGVRNAIGLVMNPVTNRLWANNNGSDNQGNEIPPEWIDIIRDGGFYGHPFAYGNKTWFNFNTGSDYQALLPITAADSLMVNKLVVPAAQLEAHSAPMAITYLNNSFPPQIRNGMLTALRGSWNAPGDQRGYKIAYIDFTDKLDTTANYTSDFCTGFLNDSVNGISWARPVGLAVNNKAEVFMTSDGGYPFILHIYPINPPVGLNNYTKPEPQATVYPNPANNNMTIEANEVFTGNLNVVIYDVLGKIVYSKKSSVNKISFDCSLLSGGFYQLVIYNEEYRTCQRIQIIH